MAVHPLAAASLEHSPIACSQKERGRSEHMEWNSSGEWMGDGVHGWWDDD